MPLTQQIKDKLRNKLRDTAPFIPSTVMSYFDNLTSVTQLPEGQLTPFQMKQVKNLLLQRAFENDYRDFLRAKNQMSPDDQNELLDQIREMAQEDRAAGGFGTARRKLEVLHRFETPLLETQPKFQPFIPDVNPNNPLLNLLRGQI